MNHKSIGKKAIITFFAMVIPLSAVVETILCAWVQAAAMYLRARKQGKRL